MAKNDVGKLWNISDTSKMFMNPLFFLLLREFMNKYRFFSGVLTLISCANYDKATVKPTCPESGRIRIIYANFGRTVQDHLLCPYGRRHGNVVDCEAHREIYTSTARELCDGKNSCTVTNIEELGDPCHGTYKYLEVRFKCTSKSFPYLIIKFQCRQARGPDPFPHVGGTQRVAIILYSHNLDRGV